MQSVAICQRQGLLTVFKLALEQKACITLPNTVGKNIYMISDNASPLQKYILLPDNSFT